MINKNMISTKKSNFYFFLTLFVVFFGFLFFEPFIAGANIDDSASFKVNQKVTSGIILSCDESAILTPEFQSSLSGLAPESAPASSNFDCSVSTNNSSGFNLFIKNKDLGGSNIALVHETDSSFKFSNYGSSTTYSWVDPLAGEAMMGFSIGAAESSAAAGDIALIFKNNGSVCGTGSNVNNSSEMSNAKCWRGLNDVTNINVASSSDATLSGQETFRFRFQARANSIALKAGHYVTDLIVTATY